MKNKKQTEKSMLKAVHNYFSNSYKYCIKNSFIFNNNWESDYFCVNREGYSFEVEVKITKTDFKNDLKKIKHGLFIDNPKKKLVPNKFYYALPPDLIDEKDIPKYAGLIIVNGSHATIKKHAPFIHKNKYDFRKILCDKFYYQWLTQKRKLNHIEYELESINHMIATLNVYSFKTEKRVWKIKTIDYPNKRVSGELCPKLNRKTRLFEGGGLIKEFEFKDVIFQ